MSIYSPMAILDAAVDLKNSGKPVEARQAFEVLINEGELIDLACYHVAVLYMETGNLQDAIVYYKKAIAINPRNINAQIDLGGIYLLQKQYSAAIHHLLFAHVSAPSEQGPVVRLAFAYFHKGHFATALQYFKMVRVSDLAFKMQEEFVVSEATCYLETGNWESACFLYLSVLKEYNYQNAIAMAQLGFIYMDKMRDYDQANYWTDEALAVNPNLSIAVKNKGLILKVLRRPEEAIAYFQYIMMTEPGNFEGYYNAARTYSDLGQEDRVERMLNDALGIAPFIKVLVKEDPDFGKYRTRKWFRDIVQK